MEEEPTRSPRLSGPRATASSRAARAHHVPEKASGLPVAWGNAVLRVEPPSEWELREGALGDQKFQGNGGEQGPTTQVRECAAARFSPRAQTQCRLCPPHPVDARTRGVRWGDSHRGLGARGA